MTSALGPTGDNTAPVAGTPGEHPSGRPARGAMLLLAAQVTVLFSGFGVSIILARVLGPETFGTYGIVIAVLGLLERVLVGGIPRAAGGMIARAAGDRRELEHATRVLMLAWGGLLGVVLWIGAPALARRFDVDAELFRILAVSIPLTAVFASCDAILGAHRRFGLQSLLQTIPLLVKLAGIVALLFAGLSLGGAIAAHVAGAMVAAAVALAIHPLSMRLPSPGPIRSILRDALTTGFYTVGLALLLNLGLWQLDARGPQEAVFVGLYVAGLNAARVLVIVPASLSGVLFSSAARAVGAGDDLSFQKYVRQTLRIGMILLAPACVLVAIDAQNVVRLLFGPEYSDAGLVLATACAAYAAMGLFDILAHALMAERRYRFTAATTCALLPLLFVMNGFLIPVAKGVGAAASLLAVFALGIVVSGATLRRRIGPLLQPRSVLRIAAACVLVGTLSAYVQADGYWLCVKFAVLGILYAGLLWVLRELSAADLAALVKAKRVSDGNAS